jgi:hypothetical protein
MRDPEPANTHSHAIRLCGRGRAGRRVCTTRRVGPRSARCGCGGRVAVRGSGWLVLRWCVPSCVPSCLRSCVVACSRVSCPRLRFMESKGSPTDRPTDRSCFYLVLVLIRSARNGDTPPRETTQPLTQRRTARCHSAAHEHRDRRCFVGRFIPLDHERRRQQQ